MPFKSTLLFFAAIFIVLTISPSYGGDIISCDSFETCPDGSVPLTNAILDLQARMDALEGDNLALQEQVATVSNQPRWRLKKYDLVTQQYTEQTSGIAMIMPTVNRHKDQRLHLVMVKTDTVRGERWLPAVMGVNSIIAFGYQGTDFNHTILAFEPNTNCTGNPVAMILKSSVGDLLDFTRPRWGLISYDYRNGNIYGVTNGGNTSSNVNYDLLEYGFDKGYFPNYEGGTGCDQNVNISTRPDMARKDLTPDGNMFYFEPELWANSPPRAGEYLSWSFE